MANDTNRKVEIRDGEELVIHSGGSIQLEDGGIVEGTFGGAASEATGDLATLIAGKETIYDLGVVDVTDLTGGKVTLFTTSAGQFITRVFFGDDFAFTDSAGVALEIGAYRSPVTPIAGWDDNFLRDSAGIGLKDEVALFANGTITGMAATPPLLSGSLTASIAGGASVGQVPVVGTTPGWQADTDYSATDDAIIESGRIWTNDGGTSGGVKPDFAGNVMGSVTDNGMTWTDSGYATPTIGHARVYIGVVTPLAYP